MAGNGQSQGNSILCRCSQVNILVEENVSPECIGKVWAVSSHNEVVFGTSDINKVVCLEKEHLCDVRIKGN